jgi:hypothetical protein
MTERRCDLQKNTTRRDRVHALWVHEAGGMKDFHESSSDETSSEAKSVKQATSSTSNPKDWEFSSTFEDDLSNLVAMGFSKNRASSVLRRKGNNFELALNELLGPSEGILETNQYQASSIDNDKTGDSGIQVVHCAVSQFDIALPTNDGGVITGHSACSCIAIFGAVSFLSSCKRDGMNSCVEVEDIITSDFLQNVVLTGVNIYSEAMQVKHMNPSCIGPEHLSPEEVFDAVGWLSCDLDQIGEIRQGLLSPGDTSSFYPQLLSCRHDEKARGGEWMAVVITKTPESVLVLLPPLLTKADLAVHTKKYILIDSHPRSHFSASGSYAILHPSLEALVYSLSVIFPPTDLGPDVSDLASMMYNSFDLYSLQAKALQLS